MRATIPADRPVSETEKETPRYSLLFTTGDTGVAFEAEMEY